MICCACELTGAKRTLITMPRSFAMLSLLVLLAQVHQKSAYNFTVTENYMRKIGPNNNTVELNCMTDVPYKLIEKIEWKRDHLSIRIMKSKTTFRKQNQILTVSPIEPKDSGIYSCKVVTLDKQVLKRKFDIPPISEPYITTSEKHYIVVREDSEVKLDCIVGAFYTLSYSWKFNDKVVSDRDHYRIRRYRFLRLRKVQQKDSGKYTCTVKNKLGERSVTYTLNVTARGDSIGDLRPTLRDNASLYVELAMNKLNLDCTSTGVTPMNVTWLRDGINIEDQTLKREHRISLSPDRQILKLTSLKLSDSGNYTCILQNKFGTVEHNMTVEIYEKLFAKPIVYSKDKHRIFYVDKGQNLTVTIYVLVFPPQVHFQMLYHYNLTTNTTTNSTKAGLKVMWTPRDFKTVSRSSRKSITVSRYRLEFYFYNISLKDYGNYSLMAGNKHGFDVYPFKIENIKYKPFVPTIPSPTVISTSYSAKSTGEEASSESTVAFIVLASLLAGIVVIGFFVYFGCRVLRKGKFNDRYAQPVETVKLNLGDGTSADTAMTSLSTTYGKRRFRRGSALDGGRLNSHQERQACDIHYKSDPDWEIPVETIHLEEQIGEGAFGRVLKASVEGLPKLPGMYTVAVKTLKDECCEQDVKDLMSEIEVMKSIGKHKNILNLLAVAKGKGQFYMVIEYCSYGNLRSFLRQRRPALPPKPQPKEKITLKDLTSFCLQAAKGMDYLASKKCIHRDIAARNILVGDDYVMKIADFGLARDVHGQEYYRKCTDGRLPVKWMAMEALFDRVYTTQSDIWAFGILIWEIVTFGGSPYPGIPLEKVFDLLKQGYRMEQPINCSDELYSLMLNCWKEIPSKRPTFSELVVDLEKMLLDLSELEYLELQPPGSSTQPPDSDPTPPLTPRVHLAPSQCSVFMGEEVKDEGKEQRGLLVRPAAVS